MELIFFVEKLRIFLSLRKENGLYVYTFGSFFTSQKFNDIDLLIVYEDFENLTIFKKAIFSEFSEFPIHITALKNTEEKELNFICKVNAVQIE